MPKSKDFALLLRVYPHTSDLDPPIALTTLGLDAENAEVSAVSSSEDPEMVTVNFRDQPELGKEEIPAWQLAEFKNAAKWLNRRNVADFIELRRLGLGVDIFLGRYWGPIPLGLLQEAARHELRIWMG